MHNGLLNDPAKQNLIRTVPVRCMGFQHLAPVHGADPTLERGVLRDRGGVIARPPLLGRPRYTGPFAGTELNEGRGFAAILALRFGI